MWELGFFGFGKNGSKLRFLGSADNLKLRLHPKENPPKDLSEKKVVLSKILFQQSAHICPSGPLKIFT